MTATLENIEQQIRTGQLDAAEAALASTSSTEDNKADLLFIKGLLKEYQYDREGAFELFQQVLDANPAHKKAMFHSGLLCDTLGDDDKALEFYEKCVADEQANVNALINLAVLYEEHNRLEDSERILSHVLDSDPHNGRARQFLNSVISSYNMVYDERQAREREKRDAVLDTPVTDFELSVRSRNCLKQMNIHTLGDLLKTTEAELLSYKNFGETSLNEIKAMLAQKGLRLGQSLQVPGSRPTVPVPSMPSSNPGTSCDIPISSLELSVRSRKCLQRLGITTLGELSQRTEAELSATRNFGETSLNEIKHAMAAYGITLREP